MDLERECKPKAEETFWLAEETKDAKTFAHNAMKVVTLKKNYEFQFVFRKGERFFSKNLTLIVAPARKCPKFGFVISKKIGKAVVRNKKRRQLKEIIRGMEDVIPKQYVILAKPEIEQATFEELKTELFGLFLKNKFLENKQ